MNFGHVMVLADRGINIGDDIALHGAILKIPAVTKGKKHADQYAGKLNTQSKFVFMLSV